MHQHIFSKTEIYWLRETLEKESANWDKAILPILRKEAEVWERILQACWERDSGSETESRAREVIKQSISHLKKHITEFEAESGKPT
jgi:hypothetical protein